MERDAQIEIYGRKSKATGRIVIGGTDISSAVTGFTLGVNTRKEAKLTIELAVVDGVVVDGANIEVGIPEETASALIALGWAPPAEKEDKT